MCLGFGGRMSTMRPASSPLVSADGQPRLISGPINMQSLNQLLQVQITPYRSNHQTMQMPSAKVLLAWLIKMQLLDPLLVFAWAWGKHLLWNSLTHTGLLLGVKCILNLCRAARKEAWWRQHSRFLLEGLPIRQRRSGPLHWSTAKHTTGVFPRRHHHALKVERILVLL